MQKEYWKATWDRKHSRRRGRPTRSRRRTIVDEAIDQAEQLQLPLSVACLDLPPSAAPVFKLGIHPQIDQPCAVAEA